VAGRPRGWPVGRPSASHMDGRSAVHLLQTDFVKLVEAPLCPYKAPLWQKTEHTPHFGDCTCKALILSIVARRNLVGKVARL
jgi:hypothetical protein